jgi:hypothetical protein
MTLEDIQHELALAVAAQLAGPSLRGRVIRAIALDVHPWHGHIGLCLLTDEDEEYPSLRVQYEEMASWRLFNLAATPQWPRVAPLAEAMRAQYEAAGDAKGKRLLLPAAAAALDSPIVTDALAPLTLAPSFERFVGDPDDPEQTNLCAPERGGGLAP